MTARDSSRRKVVRAIDTVDRTLPSELTFTVLLLGGMAFFGAIGSLLNSTQMGMVVGASTPFVSIWLFHLIDPEPSDTRGEAER